MSWLPPARREPLEEAAQPWLPESLKGRSPVGLSYVVVEEMLGSSAALSVSEWPAVDERGRLRFRGEPRTLGANRTALEDFLARNRCPGELAERPLRVGDVFGLRERAAATAPLVDELEAPQRLQPFLEPEQWIEPPAYDLTAEAREAAKTSFYAAVTPLLDQVETARLEELVERPAPPPPTPSAAVPPPWRPSLRTGLAGLGLAGVLFAGGLAAGAGLGSDTGSPNGATTTATATITTTETTATTESVTSTATTTSSETATTTVTTATTETVTQTVTTSPPPPPPPPPIG
jgi:hypothetical protein